MRQYETYKCSACGNEVEVQNVGGGELHCCGKAMEMTTENLTLVNLLKAFSGESEARNKYEYFAKVAQKEGYRDIAEHFQRAANNEKVHAKLELALHNRMLTQSDNNFGNTAENLQYAIDGESYEMLSGHEYGEVDTNRLAQGETSETHNSLLARRRNRLRGDPTKVDESIGTDDDLYGESTPSDTEDTLGTGIPIATQPNLKTVSDVSVEETRGFWEEPHPKSIKIDEKPYISSQYPYNHVHESESGHISEIDDSPGSERLFTQHMSGTFEEIHPDGSKVVKIVGDNYEIVAGASNVSITGNVNLTVAGTVRELIRGDYHLEVEGNYTQKIHKNHRVKVGAGESGGNREEEIKGNHSYNINDDVKARIGGGVETTIEKDDWKLINGKMTTAVTKDINLLSQTADINIIAKNNLTTNSASGITSFKSGSTLNIKSATLMHIKSETTIDMDATTEVDIDSATINLN